MFLREWQVLLAGGRLPRTRRRILKIAVIPCIFPSLSMCVAATAFAFTEARGAAFAARIASTRAIVRMRDRTCRSRCRGNTILFFLRSLYHKQGDISSSSPMRKATATGAKSGRPPGPAPETRRSREDSGLSRCSGSTWAERGCRSVPATSPVRDRQEMSRSKSPWRAPAPTSRRPRCWSSRLP